MILLSVANTLVLSAAIVMTAGLVLVTISLFTKLKIPVIDYSISAMVTQYYINRTRNKHNIVHSGWKLAHFDLDAQDIRWEFKVDGNLEAKLRIVYNKKKESFISFYNIWNDRRDVMSEITLDGDLQYLLKLYGISRRTYEVIQPGCACHSRITGGANHPIMTLPTNFRVED